MGPPPIIILINGVIQPNLLNCHTKIQQKSQRMNDGPSLQAQPPLITLPFKVGIFVTVLEQHWYYHVNTFTDFRAPFGVGPSVHCDKYIWSMTSTDRSRKKLSMLRRVLCASLFPFLPLSPLATTDGSTTSMVLLFWDYNHISHIILRLAFSPCCLLLSKAW